MPVSPSDITRAYPAARNTGAPTAGTVEIGTGPSAFKRLPATLTNLPVDANLQKQKAATSAAPPAVVTKEQSQQQPQQQQQQQTQQGQADRTRPQQSKGGPQPEGMFHAIWDKIHGRFTWKTKTEQQQQQQPPSSLFDGMQLKERSPSKQQPKATAPGPARTVRPPSDTQKRSTRVPAPGAMMLTAAGRAEALATAVRNARLNHRQAKAEAMRREAQFWSATARAEREYEASKAVLDGVERALYARIIGAADAPVEVMPIPLPPPFPGAAMPHAVLMTQHPQTLQAAEKGGFGFVSSLRAAPARAKSAIGAAPAVVEAKNKFERAHFELRDSRAKAGLRAARFANTHLAFQHLEEQAMNDLTKEAEFAFCDAQACPDGHVDLCLRCDGTPSVFIGSRGAGDRDAAGNEAAEAHERRLHATGAAAAAAHGPKEDARLPVRNAPAPGAAEAESNLEAAGPEKELPTNVTVYQAIIRSRAAEADVERLTAALALAHQAARTRTETAKQQLETALIALDAAAVSPGESGVLILPKPEVARPEEKQQQGKHAALPRPTEVVSTAGAEVDEKQKKSAAEQDQDARRLNADLEARLRRVAEVSSNLDGLRAQNEREIQRAQMQLNKALDDRRDAQTKLRTILTGASLRSLLPTKAWFRSWFVKPEDDAEVRADMLRRRVAAAAERVMDAAQNERAYAEEFQVDASRDAYDVAHAEEDLRDAERELAAAVEAEVKRLQHNAALGAAGARPDELEEVATPNYDQAPHDAAATAGQAAGNPVKASGWFRGRFPTLAERTESPGVDKQFRSRDVAYLSAHAAPPRPTAAAMETAEPKSFSPSSPSSSADSDEGEITFVPVSAPGAARPVLPEDRFGPQKQPRPPTPVNVKRDAAAARDDDDVASPSSSASSAQLLGHGHVLHAGNERRLGDRALALPRDEISSPPLEQQLEQQQQQQQQQQQPQQQPQQQQQHQPTVQQSHAPISTDALLLRFVDALKAKRAAEGRLRTTQDSQQEARAAAWSALRTSESELAWALRNLSQWQTWHTL